MVIASQLDTKRVDWDTFRRRYWNPNRWEQGQHVSLIGPNGRGKSVLAMRGILPVREAAGAFVIIFDVKADDPSLRDKRFTVARSWSEVQRRMNPDRRLFRLAPPARKREDLPKQRKVFTEALDGIFREGLWTVYVDELRIMADPRYMGLQSRLEALWLFGRSRGVSLVASTQAPRWVPRAAYDQAYHLFIWRNRDEQALRRLAEVGGDTKQIQAAVRSLGRHEFLYVDVVRDRMVISELDLPDRGGMG